MQVSLDLAGISVFALSGALVAVRKKLDVVGVLVLALVTGLGGGMLRDLLIGAVPPATLQDWRYLLVPMLAGLVVFRFHPRIARIEPYINVSDALGLGLFCVTGSAKAMQYGLGPVPSALMGVLTGIGGGILRDLLAGRTPIVLRQEVYALPALAGALVVVVPWELGLYRPWVAIAAAGVCIALRLLAIRFRWEMPHAGSLRG
nr:trimeric intracellular cation channel family protein [Microlunatus panaciterrae]